MMDELEKLKEELRKEGKEFLDLPLFFTKVVPPKDSAFKSICLKLIGYKNNLIRWWYGENKV